MRMLKKKLPDLKPENLFLRFSENAKAWLERTQAINSRV